MNAKRSSCAAVLAYRVGVNLKDPYDGKMKYPHRARADILSHFLVNWDSPDCSNPTKTDYQNIIDEIGRTETRSNSRLFREFQLALPKEGTNENRKRLVMEFALYLARKYGVVVIPAIHDAPDDQTGNFHAHVLTTTRLVERENGKLSLGDKNRLLNSPDMLAEVRKHWERLLNRYYQSLQIDKTVSCASYETQKIGKIPTIHEGPWHRRNKGSRWHTNRAISLLNQVASKGVKSLAEVWANVEKQKVGYERRLERSNQEIAAAQKEIQEALENTKLNSRQQTQCIRLKEFVTNAIRGGGTSEEISEKIKTGIGRKAEDKNAFYRLKKSLPPAGGDDGIQRARDGVDLLASLFESPNDETVQKLKRWAQGETQKKPVTPIMLQDPLFLDSLRDWEIEIGEPEVLEQNQKKSDPSR